MKRNQTDAKGHISYARLKIEMAEKTAKWWKEHPPRKPNGPDAAWNDLSYKDTMRLMKDQLQQLQWARDELARAVKNAEDIGPANSRAVANVEARISKWCGSERAASYAEPIVQPASPRAPTEDRNMQNFPLASCKGWDGTVTERSGVDTENASLRGVITKANVEEFCNRIVPEDKPARDEAVVACIQDTLPTATKVLVSARANCRKATLVFNDGMETKRVQFPVGNDTSCGSGMPPMIAQFQKLCPRRAAELHVE